MKKLAFFAALCLFLSGLEYAVPKPLPFMRLGLANLPLMLALQKLPFRQLCLLALLKILAQGMLGGTVFSYIFAFSVAGTLAGTLAMYAAYALGYRRNAVSFVGVSLCGAAANNAAQLALSYAFLFGQNTRYIAPLLLCASLVTAPALGLFANAFVSQSQWYASLPVEN